MRIASYTDFRNNMKNYMDSIIENSDTVIINRGDRNGVVLISLNEYNSRLETEYIMSSPETVQRIKTAEKEIRDGNSIAQKDGESIVDFLNRVACTE